MTRTERDRPAALAASEASQAKAKRENDKAWHTPGPWQCLPEEADQDYIRIRGTRLGGRYKVANVHHLRYRGAYEDLRLRDDAETFANARLIAAAPEMLDALKAIVDCAGPGAGPEIGLALDAIQKATGDTE